MVESLKNELKEIVVVQNEKKYKTFWITVKEMLRIILIVLNASKKYQQERRKKKK